MRTGQFVIKIEKRWVQVGSDLQKDKKSLACSILYPEDEDYKTGERNWIDHPLINSQVLQALSKAKRYAGYKVTGIYVCTDFQDIINQK